MNSPRALLFCSLALLLFSACAADDATSEGSASEGNASEDRATATKPVDGDTKPVGATPADGNESPADAAADEPSAQGQPEASAHAADHTDRPPNRLAKESSPYLRMHMHNPVDWYPWGPEAFQKAKQENKPIFLSVGYSSCYWCHVMERESFMDDEIAAFLNKNFVCIKVDREERPDVDNIYMMAVQLIARRGGWPMSVFMLPDGKPFFGGTYFPARDGDRPGAPGFLTIAQRIQSVYENDRDSLSQTAGKVTELIQKEQGGPESIDEVQLSADLLDKVLGALVSSFDEKWGGFGFNPVDPKRPKFPEASNLWFLLDHVERTGDEESLRMLTTTLDRMAMGGIWDHLGGGFHRYSTDRFWRIPHFEKMLYDNGQLLSVYSRAFKLTGNEAYRRVVDQTVAFMLREMKGEGGAFYSALDAESERVEGKYYRWTSDELETVLASDAKTFGELYGTLDTPNFEHEFHVPELESLLSPEDEARMEPLRAKLLAVRDKRTRPLTDDKILCSWNGLAIRGLADAGRFCERPEYTDAAMKAAEFVLENLRDAEGRLLRTYRLGEAKLNAYLDDYALLVDGLIAIHEATSDERWLQQADELTQQQLEYYGDSERGAFFFTPRDHETLIARSKQLTDGAQPAGNTVAAQNLIYLAKQLQRPEYREFAERTIKNAAISMDQYPRIAPRMAVALAELVSTQAED